MPLIRITANTHALLSQFFTVSSRTQLLQQLRQHCDDLTRCMGNQAVMDNNGTVRQ